MPVIHVREDANSHSPFAHFPTRHDATLLLREVLLVKHNESTMKVAYWA